MNTKDPRRNKEGYYDPTAYMAMRSASRDEDERQQEVNLLIRVIRYIIDRSGFELMDRIALKDKKTGRVFR